MVSDVAKKIVKTGAVMAVELAIKQLLDAVDWVMDPANNQVRYTIPVNQVKDTEAIAYCKKLAQERGRTYGSLRVNKGENYIYFDCMNPYLNQYGSYSPNREGVISNNVIAQQIIANANKKSELYSQVYVGEVADDNITTAEKEKQWEKTKKKVDEPKRCLPVTEANIRMVLEPTTELTAQDSVSLAKIKGMVAWIENGGATNMDPIYVYENYLIVNGNYRFISMKLCKMNAPKINWIASPSDIKRAYPIKNIRIDESWYGD